MSYFHHDTVERSCEFPRRRRSPSNRFTLPWNVEIPDTFNCFVKRVVPVTVDIPANVNVPPSGVIPSNVSTYVLTAFCVETLLSLFCDKVISVENSLIEAPIKPPTEPSLKDSRPDKLNADASNVTLPVAWSTLNWSPTQKLPKSSVAV